MNRKKLILIIGATMVAVGAAGAGAFIYWTNNPPPPDPKTAKPEEMTNYLASDQFAKLPVEKKQAYLEEIHQTSDGNPYRMMRSGRNLPEKQREKLFENIRPVFMARMRKEIDQYYKLPPEERTAYLDERIDRHEHRRQEHQARRAADGNDRPNESRRGPSRRRHRMTPEHLKRMIESTPAKDRARFMEFRKAMRKRRKERGLPDHPRGRH